MNEQERKLVFDLALGRMSAEEFVHRFPHDLRADPLSTIQQCFASAIENKDDAGLEACLILAQRFGYPEHYSPLLSGLLSQDWHHSHEVIADLLERVLEGQHERPMVF